MFKDEDAVIEGANQLIWCKSKSIFNDKNLSLQSKINYYNEK